ncbi:MAG: hypothetical protein CMJ78_02250 [Planctomycetaceae bacterium]|nr:hypothetical protein [Planctomycetaceae bacterium]
MRFRSALIASFLAFIAASVYGGDASLLDQRPQPWQRREKPILSAHTTKQAWCKIVCYSPHVIHHDGKFRMWYLGTSTASRANDIVMGFAESNDGIRWTEHPDSPILTADDVPWGKIIQTPFVLFDQDDKVFKMWFVSGNVPRDKNGKLLSNDQRLGYATSHDGIAWKVHPKPLFPSARSPSVIKESASSYRMWMGSRPDVNDHNSGELYTNIYEFTSPDGIAWQRSSKPVLQPTGPARSTVYPFVIKQGKTYAMWYGCHVAGGKFELFFARSDNGHDWRTDHDRPAFPAAEDKKRFDGRYTSTPCIVKIGERYLLYYSARDWQNGYIDSQGRKRRDGSGVYSHIGVAELRNE